MVPAGSDLAPGEKVSAGQLAETVYDCIPVQLFASVAVIVNEADSTTSGVPEISPVFGLSEAHELSEPEVTAYVYGPVPPPPTAVIVPLVPPLQLVGSEVSVKVNAVGCRIVNVTVVTQPAASFTFTV